MLKRFSQAKMHPAIKRIIDYPKIAQRTPEWYEYRKKRVTASEASTIIAQGKGYDRVFEQKVGIRDTNISSEYMTIGTDNEEAVVVLYREKYPDEEVFHDLSIIPHQTLDYVAASLDACTASGINVEIKTVFKDKFVKVSKMYYDQVQLQMEVADLDKTHLVQHYFRMPGQPIVVHEILRDRQWFERNKDIFKRFVQEVRDFFPFVNVDEFGQ
jgi:putative phage-type endonuclease